jgi:predicted dienelactone hydrolase
MYNPVRKLFCYLVKNITMYRIAILFFFVISLKGEIYGQERPGYDVGQRTFPYEDKSRNRRLITEVWYPTAEKASAEDMSPFLRIPTKREAAISPGTFPLILFSHGTGGGRLTVEWFCTALASKGYIVAAVDHFGNTFDNPIPLQFVTFWERPQDIRFILDQLLASKDLATSIALDKIGAAGFSLGGYTAITLAGAKMDLYALKEYLKSEEGKKEADIPEMPGLITLFEKPEVEESYKKAPPLQEKRIKSVFVMSPAVGQAFPTKENFKDVTIPVYIVVAARDMLAPALTNAAHYAKNINKAQYKVLGTEAGHYIFLNEAKDGLKQELPALFSDPPGESRKAVHDEALRLAVEHFGKTLK